MTALENVLYALMLRKSALPFTFRRFLHSIDTPKKYMHYFPYSVNELEVISGTLFHCSNSSTANLQRKNMKYDDIIAENHFIKGF